MDQVVRLYDAGIQPDKIEPIKAWKGNYGKRGALRQFLMETFRSRAPEYITSKELGILVVQQFSLTFSHESLYGDWFRGSLKGTIQVLTNQGYLERRHAAEDRSQQFGAWRWKQEQTKTLAELRAQA